MMLLWRKHANPKGWLTHTGRKATGLAIAGGRGGLQPRPPSQPGLLNDGEEDLGGRILTLASGLDMSVTVEAVKTRDQFERLKSLGVNFRARLSDGPPGADRRARTSAADLSPGPGRGPGREPINLPGMRLLKSAVPIAIKFTVAAK